MADLERAFFVANEIWNADRFNNADLRKFIVAAKCVIKSSETGKGTGLVPRHLKTINDFAFDCEDLTGNVQTITQAAFQAARTM